MISSTVYIKNENFCLLKNINKKASEKLRKIFADINQGF